MTVTIDLSPTEQAQLMSAARRTGLEPAALAKKLVTEHLPPDGDAHEQARIAAIYAARGSMAHVGVSVDDLHRERQADKGKEEQDGAGGGR